MCIQECPFKPLNDLEAQRLVISRSFMTYQNEEQIVRYATTNKMSPAVGQYQRRPVQVVIIDHYQRFPV